LNPNKAVDHDSHEPSSTKGRKGGGDRRQGGRKAVEIGGYADRQDLRLSLLKLARNAGVRISLGTDAHHPEQLGYMELSLAAACLAKIAPERIINFMPLSELKQWVASVRRNHS
jgi:histidinol phosphatase-like PHP family hydrolase